MLRAFPTVHWTQYWAWNVNPVCTCFENESLCYPREKAWGPSPTFLFRKVLATNLTPACSEEDATKAFLRICQEHKSTWSLQDLKSIFKPPSILLPYTYISRSKCALHLHIPRTEKIFGKETSAVLSQSVDIAHAVLIQIRMLQLKENCVIFLVQGVWKAIAIVTRIRFFSCDTKYENTLTQVYSELWGKTTKIKNSIN